MSVVITERPRKPIKGGNLLSWVQANNPVIYKWQRQDSGFINSVSGPGITVKIFVTTDFSSTINVGDAIYVQSDDGTYASGGKVTAITATEIQTDIPFTSNSGPGYFNYKRAWFLDIRLRNRLTDDVIVDNIKVQSTPSGIVCADIGAYLKAFTSYENNFNYDVLNEPDENIGFGFYVEFAERSDLVTVSAFQSDEANPTWITNGVAQIQDPGGQMLEEYQLFPDYLSANNFGPVAPASNIDISDPGDGFVYFLTDNTELEKVDPFSVMVISTLTFSSAPSSMTYNEDLNELAVVDVAGVVHRVDLTTFTIIGSFPAQLGANRIEYVNDKNMYAIADAFNVEFYNATTGAFIIQVGPVVNGMANMEYYEPNGTLYVLSFAAMALINTDSFTFTLLPPNFLFFSVTGITLVNDGIKDKFVWGVPISDVVQFDLTTNVATNVTLTGSTGSVSFDSVDNVIYYYYASSFTVMILNPVDLSVIGNYDFTKFVPTGFVGLSLVHNGSRRGFGFTQLGSGIYGSHELPPPPLPDFMDKWGKVSKMWRNYPFDLTFAYSEELRGFPLTVNFDQLDSDGNSINAESTSLSQSGLGLPNRLTFPELDGEAKEIKINITRGDRVFDYDQGDYTPGEYN